MGYDKAIGEAWARLAGSHIGSDLSIGLFDDDYLVDLKQKIISSKKSGIKAKDHISIILLHFIARSMSAAPMPRRANEWMDFNSLDGGNAYYPTFKKRTIDRIALNFGKEPELLLKAAEKIGAVRAPAGDAGIIAYPFKETPIMITVYKPDEEFGAEANILFDKSISDIFCTEDIVVLTEITVHSLSGGTKL